MQKDPLIPGQKRSGGKAGLLHDGGRLSCAEGGGEDSADRDGFIADGGRICGVLTDGDRAGA